MQPCLSDLGKKRTCRDLPVTRTKSAVSGTRNKFNCCADAARVPVRQPRLWTGIRIGDAMEAAGCVRVAIRFRPSRLHASDADDEADNIVFDEAQGTITVHRKTEMAYSGRKEMFAFSSVHRSESNQALFESVGIPLCNSVLGGYNGALLAYGQTGSGKTFTMGEVAQIGSPYEGMSHRMVRQLFSAIAEDREHTYEITMQYVQVYCERVYDLLSDKPRLRRQDSSNSGRETDSFGTPSKRSVSTRLEFGSLVRQESSGGGSITPGRGAGTPGKDTTLEDTSLSLREDKKLGVYVQGATTSKVRSTEEALGLMEKAATHLTFASTHMNQHSSRSHALCSLLIRAPNAPIPMRVTALATSTHPSRRCKPSSHWSTWPVLRTLVAHASQDRASRRRRRSTVLFSPWGMSFTR